METLVHPSGFFERVKYDSGSRVGEYSGAVVDELRGEFDDFPSRFVETLEEQPAAG